MTTGTVDNYLTPEEEEYFKNGGKDESSFDESYANESGESEEDQRGTDEEDAEGSRLENSGDSEENAKQEEDEETEELELEGKEDSDDDTESKRDYKKAYKTAIHKRKEMKEALEAQAQKAKELEDNLTRLQQIVAQSQQNQSMTQKQQEPKEEVPDPETDPLGYQQYKINKLEQATVAQQKYLQQQYEQSQKAQQQQAFIDTYKAQAAQFSKQTPDFLDAYSHLVQDKLAEYQEAGYSQQEAQQLLIEDEMAIVAKAFKDKVNPAERLYKTAKLRGYSGKASKEAPKKNLKDIQKGMDNAKSLKSGGGEREAPEGSIDDIDNMNFQEFEDFFDKFKAKAKGRL